ncbi:CheR family methyltransferase [Vibrio sonorensis]|uniref:CheR family methyltransferase n=1 Tax=Vibrio sonorensis TaxID=1004316 RepID=UPI0008D8F273|nr:protein-glutamate O-methyltransferase CheR [Vibrio sonorensis]
MSPQPLTKAQFACVQTVLEQNTGIRLGQHKRVMVENRLANRLKLTNCESFDQYLSIITSGNNEDEFHWFIDKLTTHETSFFREAYQFEHLKHLLTDMPCSSVKAWSAACSTGEEAYSIAMTLDDICGSANWSLVGSDVSAAAILKARKCRYELSLADKIPSEYRQKYCLKGVGEHEGYFTMSKVIRRFCQFKQYNLMNSDAHSQYNVIFLRNILIYFDSHKQGTIIDNVLSQLLPNGLLFLGHSENVLRGRSEVVQIENCIYRRTGK